MGAGILRALLLIAVFEPAAATSRTQSLLRFEVPAAFCDRNAAVYDIAGKVSRRRGAASR